MMKKFCVFIFGLIFFLTSQATAQNKVVVIPLLDDRALDECDCPITQEQVNEIYERLERLEWRFKDMGDGTIRDNKTGLLWLKNANCYDGKNWFEATTEASLLENGICGLNDGSAPGDWRLPTKGEWGAIITRNYTYPALLNTKGDLQWSEGDAFTGVQSNTYWSSTEVNSEDAFTEALHTGIMGYGPKTGSQYVWPVRD